MRMRGPFKATLMVTFKEFPKPHKIFPFRMKIFAQLVSNSICANWRAFEGSEGAVGHSVMITIFWITYATSLSE